MSQRTQCKFVLVLIALNSHVNTGIAEIVRDAYFSDSDHRQSRIFKLVPDNLRDLFAQRVRNALCSVHNEQSAGGSKQKAGKNAVSCRLPPTVQSPRSVQSRTLRSGR